MFACMCVIRVAIPPLTLLEGGIPTLRSFSRWGSAQGDVLNTWPVRPLETGPVMWPYKET